MGHTSTALRADGSESFFTNLVNFWREYKDLESPPYVHHKDRKQLESIGALHQPATRFTEYLRGPNLGFETTNLTLAIRPVPYIGDLLNADIFILALNPGFALNDLWAEDYSPEYKSSCRKTLRQEDLQNEEFPFFMLNPNFCWHDTYQYWEKKLRTVVQEVARKRFNGSYYDALAYCSKRIAVIELVPYASAAFGYRTKIMKLDSVQYAITAAQRVGNRKDALTVVTRQADLWGLEPSEQVCVYKGSETRNASLRTTTRGGERILKRLLNNGKVKEKP
jgi:hypothetical protein